MSKYGSFLYGTKAYGSSVVNVANLIDQPESLGFNIPYYIDMVNLLADEHVYPIDDHYIATVASPTKFTITGQSGENAEVRLTINGTSLIREVPVLSYTYDGTDAQLPQHPVWDITEVKVNGSVVPAGSYELVKAVLTGDVDRIHFISGASVSDAIVVTYRSGLYEVADNSGYFSVDTELFYGLNTIGGTYYYINSFGAPVYGTFEPVYCICNNIHLFLYMMAHQFENTDTELNAISTDSNLLATRGERLAEIWAEKLNFPYSENATYAQYRAILFGLTRIYLEGSTLYNLKYALQLIASNPNVKIYEYWKDSAKMVANLNTYWQWNNATTLWNGTTYPWVNTKVFQKLGLTPFGCQIFFPIDNYIAPLDYAKTAIELTRPAHLIYALILWLSNTFTTPDNDVTYTLT